MKSFVVYVKGHVESEKQAARVVSSCWNSGFEAELMPGYTPKTLDAADQYPDANNSRIVDFKSQPNKTYLTKKACFLNHVKVWKQCIELNEPVAFLEHDVGNVRNWIDESFDELLILNAESAFKQPVFDHVRNKPVFNLGKHTYKDTPLKYRHNNQWRGAALIPGTGAYAVTPKGAKRLLNALDEMGWEQSDFFINSYNVNIEYIKPEYFTFISPNLNLSHGI